MLPSFPFVTSISIQNTKPKSNKSADKNFLLWEIFFIVLLPKECHQSLSLCVVCFSEQTPSLWRLLKNGALLCCFQWLVPWTISNTHLHLHLLKPITKVPQTTAQIPPQIAKIRVFWLLKRHREWSKLRLSACSQPTQCSFFHCSVVSQTGDTPTNLGDTDCHPTLGFTSLQS